MSTRSHCSGSTCDAPSSAPPCPDKLAPCPTAACWSLEPDSLQSHPGSAVSAVLCRRLTAVPPWLVQAREGVEHHYRHRVHAGLRYQQGRAALAGARLERRRLLVVRLRSFCQRLVPWIVVMMMVVMMVVVMMMIMVMMMVMIMMVMVMMMMMMMIVLCRMSSLSSARR